MEVKVYARRAKIKAPDRSSIYDMVAGQRAKKGCHCRSGALGQAESFRQSNPRSIVHLNRREVSLSKISPHGVLYICSLICLIIAIGPARPINQNWRLYYMKLKMTVLAFVSSLSINAFAEAPKATVWWMTRKIRAIFYGWHGWWDFRFLADKKAAHLVEGIMGTQALDAPAKDT